MNLDPVQGARHLCLCLLCWVPCRTFTLFKVVGVGSNLLNSLSGAASELGLIFAVSFDIKILLAKLYLKCLNLSCDFQSIQEVIAVS